MAVKETIEVFDLLDGLAVFIREAKEDGKVDFRDLPKAIPLIGLGKNAIAGSENIIAEIKSAAGEELDEVISRLIKSVTGLVEAALS